MLLATGVAAGDGLAGGMADELADEPLLEPDGLPPGDEVVTEVVKAERGEPGPIPDAVVVLDLARPLALGVVPCPELLDVLDRSLLLPAWEVTTLPPG